MDSWRTKTSACWLMSKIPLILPHQLIFHCSLIVIYLTPTSGCWRRQVQMDDVASVAMGLTSTTTQHLSHRLDCHPEEVAYAACLNGGTCFAVELQLNSRLVQCRCTSEWQGERCESLFIDPDHWAIEEAKEQATKLAIVLAFGITVAILLIILIAITIVYLRQRQKHAEEFRKKKEEERTRQDDLQTGSTAVYPSKSHAGLQQQRTIIIPISTV